MKIVINSHVKYSKARQVLFESLNKIGFTDKRDIIVVYSGSENDIEPYICDNGYVIIESKLNNFDYNAYHMLYIYKDHSLIKDNFYLYLHDTITFDKSFNDTYHKIKKILLNITSDTIFIPKSFHSNICLFGNKVIDEYKDNFSLPLDKTEAIYLELHSSYVKNNKTIYNIGNYGSKYLIADRVEIDYPIDSLNGIDIYNNGNPRRGFYYPFFSIYKWILWGKNGDFTESKIKDNNCWWS
jgi:hypothetical protein